MRTKLLASVGLVGLAALLVAAERRRPLRSPRAKRAPRQARNLALTVLAGLTIAIAETPITVMLARRVVRRRLGLLQQVPLPAWAEIVGGVVLMDGAQWVWHYLTHAVPVLWRFHAVHHVDADMDASTATRFHPGELLLSVPFRAAQIRVLGISPRVLAAWQTLTTAQILFQHSNVRLPERLDRALAAVIVTPRMHGIHHSNRPEEQGSNWGTIFSLFDRALGLQRLDVPARSITIGLRGLGDAPVLDPDLAASLALPFTSIASSPRCARRGRAPA